MKTITVRMLRNEFAKVSTLLESGESIAITRHGRVIANLTPPAQPKKHKKPDWKNHLKNWRPVGKGLNAEETEAFWKEMRRD